MLPSKLYHGTGFNDLVLKPGYEHTGKEIKWDETESNRYLYATTDKESAIGLGWASSIEKSFELDRFKIEGDILVIELSSKHRQVGLKELLECPVFLHEFKPKSTDHWELVGNAVNNFQSEYKTNETIRMTKAPTRIDIRKWVRTKKATIINNPPPSAGW